MWTDGGTDGPTDMTKLIVALRNFANAPINSFLPVQNKASQQNTTEGSHVGR